MGRLNEHSRKGALRKLISRRNRCREYALPAYLIGYIDPTGQGSAPDSESVASHTIVSYRRYRVAILL
jgi:hypothetical protein